MANKKEVMENGKNYKVIGILKRKMGKTSEEQVIEKAIDNLEDLVLEVEAQIANLKTARIPAAQLAVTRAERDLGRAIKEFEESKSVITSNLASYIQNWNNGKAKVRSADDELNNKKLRHKAEENDLLKYTEILEYLTAKE